MSRPSLQPSFRFWLKEAGVDMLCPRSTWATWHWVRVWDGAGGLGELGGGGEAKLRGWSGLAYFWVK